MRSIAPIAAAAGLACAHEPHDADVRLRAEVADLRAEVRALQAAQEADRAAIEATRASQRAALDTMLDALKAPPDEEPPRPDPAVVYAVPVGDAPVRGPADAWVTIVEVADFQCPFCARAAETIDALGRDYGADLRVVFLHNPLDFHPRARAAAHAGECAREQGRFWELHDAIFAPRLRFDLADESIAAGARKIRGLDFRKWRTCVNEKRHEQRIANDQATAQRFGAHGTPTFFVNGRVLVGAQPPAAFRVLIDEELARAKASGTPRGDYYRVQVLGKGAPGP